MQLHIEYTQITNQIFHSFSSVDKKFGMGDYVGNDSPHTKIQNDCPIGGVAASA